jgi:hypothetical protein
MVDGSVSGLVVAAVIDAIIFTILVVVFSTTKDKRSRPPEDPVPKECPIRDEHQTSFTQAIKGVLSTPIPTQIEQIGKETWAYLQVHKIFALVMASFAVFGWVPLIAVYIAGDSSVDTDVDQTSLGHIYSEEDMLAAPMVFLFVFSIIYAVSLFYLTRHFNTNALHQPEAEKPTASNILMLEGLPKDLVSHEHSPQLLAVIREVFSEAQGAYIVPDYAAAYRTSLLVKQTKETLANTKQREAVTGKEELLRPKLCAGKVKAVEFLTSKIAQLEATQTEELDKGRNKTSGQAFIEFSSAAGATLAQLTFRAQKWAEGNAYGMSKLEVRHAPSTEELNWHNLDANASKVRVMKVVYQSLFVLIFLIFLTPAAVLAYVGALAPA